MKQFILLIIFMLNGRLGVNAQTVRYSVFSFSGKVQVKQDSNWKDVTKGMSLGAFDELNIPTNGSIKILEHKTNSIYKSNSSGITTVRLLIKEAKSQSESSLSGLTQAFTKGMSTKPDNNNRFHSVAAAHRGRSSCMSLEDSICSTIAYTASQLLESDSQLQDTTIVGRRIIEDETYVFSLENTSDLAYCVNIVSINSETKTCRLMFSPGYEENQPYVILDAHTKAILGEFTYLSNSNERYFVFATDYLFDNEEVNTMLEDYQITEGEDLIKMRFFEIK